MRSIEFIIEDVVPPVVTKFKPVDLTASAKGKDWPIGEQQIGNVNVTIMNHFMIRCNNKDVKREMADNRVDIRKGLSATAQLCHNIGLFKSLPTGKLWVWNESLQHAIGGVKQLDKNGVMQFTLKTVLAKKPWDSSVPVFSM